MGNSISEVSVFVDESGSFDSRRSPSRYYLVSLVFHDQSRSVENEIVELENALGYMTQSFSNFSSSL